MTEARFFDVHVQWDPEADVWFVEDGPIQGLTGEARTLEALVAVLQVRVPELLRANDAPPGPWRIRAHCKLAAPVHSWRVH